ASGQIRHFPHERHADRVRHEVTGDDPPGDIELLNFDRERPDDVRQHGGDDREIERADEDRQADERENQPRVLLCARHRGYSLPGGGGGSVGVGMSTASLAPDSSISQPLPSGSATCNCSAFDDASSIQRSTGYVRSALIVEPMSGLSFWPLTSPL